MASQAVAIRGKNRERPETLDQLIAEAARNPKDPKIRFRLGRMYDSKGRYSEAREEFLACVKLQPHNRQAYEYLALLYEGEQQYEKAITAYQKAIQLEQTQSAKSEWPYLNYGILLSKTNRSEEAVGLFEEALRKSPNSAKAHFELGRVLLQLERFEAAKTPLLRAVELNPDLPRSHYFLGNVYQRLKKTEKARVAWARFRELERIEADKKVRSEQVSVGIRGEPREAR